MADQRDAESRVLLNNINLKPLTADPSVIKDGDVWYVKTAVDAGKLKFKVGGAIVTISQAGVVAVQ